jgi:hypothetical protein
MDTEHCLDGSSDGAACPAQNAAISGLAEYLLTGDVAWIGKYQNHRVLRERRGENSECGAFCREAAYKSQQDSRLRLSLRYLSVTPPDTHRRFIFNLRCVSGGDTERIGSGRGGRVSPETSLFAETGLIRPGLAVAARTRVLPQVTNPSLQTTTSRKNPISWALSKFHSGQNGLFSFGTENKPF